MAILLKWAPFLVLILGGVSYQLSLKALPSNVSPFALLTCVYGLASVCCAAVVLVISGWTPQAWSRSLQFLPIVGVALGVIMIEGGYLLSYRAGIPLSTLMLSSVVSVTVILLFIGRCIYSDSLSAVQTLGIVLCLIGIALIKLCPPGTSS